ncbi:MAG: SapC family protein [Nitrosomonas sp.]|nr:SapC family protein [Nitrosomonas sp.]MCW5608142.1 SapC family protein [Nitrosomonas sp.]
MFKQLKPLNPKHEPSPSLDPNQSYRFAAAEMLLPVVAAETRLIAREYPIIFSLKDKELPMVVVGLRPGENAYVNEAGQWRARYIPVHIRRYPFLFADVTQDPSAEERRFAIMYDSEAPHIKHDGSGLALFKDGQPSEILSKIEAVLVDLQKDIERTKYLTAQIAEYGLLMDKKLKVTDKNQDAVELTGLRVVDAEAFGRLPAEALHALHQSGALSLCHAHFISLTNLVDGILSTAVINATKPGNGQDGFLSFANVDWSKLSS